MRKVLKRRRIEAKTDYLARMELIKAKKPRLVIRKTNRYIIAQLVETTIAQDAVIIGVTSKDLLTKGWPKEAQGSLKSLPAAYLTGFLLAKSAKGKVKEVIVDFGLHRNVQKSRIYAVVKGALDAGLEIPCNEKALPDLESIQANEKVGSLVEKLKAKL